MQRHLQNLYDTLGLELHVEEPTLLFEDGLMVHFDETAQGLEMICPLGELPTEPELLRHALKMNYAKSVVLAADADGAVLLALVRLPEDTSGGELSSALERLIHAAREIKSELGLV